MSVRPAMFSPVASSSRLGRDKSVQSTRPVTLSWYLTTIGYNLESESLLPSVQTENGWRARVLTTFDCELSANADIMELDLVRAAPYFFAS